MSSVDSSVGQGGDFAKGPAGGNASVYDTTPSGLGMNPAYLAGGAVATANVTGTSGAVIALAVFPPASPADGQMVTLELPSTYDPVGGKKLRWNLIYNAGDAVWDFIGGPALYAEVLTAETTASATYAALTTAGPSILLPRPGDYAVTIGAQGYLATGTGPCFMSYDIGVTGAVDADYISFFASNNFFSTGARSREKAGLTAITLTAKYKNDGSVNAAHFQNRWMTTIPVRLT